MWHKRKVYNLHLKNNLFDIRVPCIKIAKSEPLFEQYIMDLNQYKYDIEVLNDNTIKHNQRLYDFMQQRFNRLDELYLREICLLIDTRITTTLSQL